MLNTVPSFFAPSRIYTLLPFLFGPQSHLYSECFEHRAAEHVPVNFPRKPWCLSIAGVIVSQSPTATSLTFSSSSRTCESKFIIHLRAHVGDAMVLCTSLRMIYHYTAMLHERDDLARQYKSLRRISLFPPLSHSVYRWNINPPRRPYLF